jgi:DNA polymerase-3 subunit alpha
MPTYFPLKVHSHFSLSLGLSKPNHIARRIRELGLEGSVFTDTDSISGSIDFLQIMAGDPKKGKSALKAVIGCELTIVKDEEKTKNCGTLLLLAKNLNGWLSLSRAISKANHRYYYEKPHITVQELGDIISKNDVVAISGYLGSEVGDFFFESPREIYLSNDYVAAKEKVNKNWLAETTARIAIYKEIFGAENLYLGVQLVDVGVIPARRLAAEGVRYLGKHTNTKLVAIPDSYYATKEDAYDQRVLLVNSLGTNLKTIARKPVQGDDIALGRFFNNINYHIPSYNEMVKYGHTQEELENSVAIAAMCSPYSLSSPPMLPQFPTPNGTPSKDFMKELCREGWTRRWPQISRVIAAGKHTKEEYIQRFNTEFEVLTNVGLADYFLIVNDITAFAINDGQLTGAGRGSAAGSLILYLLGVTHVDPIEYDLLFERFYNAGRNTPGNISLPDVDMDFEKNGRERVLQYVRDKYGAEKVAQMITFNRMQGRGALKDVSRAHDVLDNETINIITKLLPNEPEIADQLQIVKEADEANGGDGEASIIEWALENHPSDYKEWAYFDDDGKLQGPLSKIFEQAIRMEGTKRASGKHAAGLVIAQKPLKEICPMAYDSSTGEMIAAMEMNALEKMGHVKFDFLGISTLDKIHAATNHLRTGKLYL